MAATQKETSVTTHPTTPQRNLKGRIPKQRTTLTLLALTLLLATTALLSLALGTRPIAPTTILDYLTNTPTNPTDTAVLNQRVTRTIWAATIGASLALAGAAMQGLTRNPLGDPGILGINAGAAFAVVTGITFFSINTTSSYALWAFTGATLTSILVYSLASIGSGGATPVKLALMGAAITAGLSSITSAFILHNHNTLDDLRRWQVGTVAGANPHDLYPSGLLLILGALIILTHAKSINNFALGDDMATALGENTTLKRATITLGITLLVGTAVALTGPIAFLGLMAPHAMRALTGPNYQTLLPTSALFGASILITADTIGRIILPPEEVQVGVTTVIVGVPVFLYLVRRAKAVNL